MLAKGGNAVDAAIASADRHHHRRADHERHRRRRLLHPVGRHASCRPQRLGPFAGADDARPVRGPGQDAEHRLGQRQRAGRGVALDDPARALRQAALRRPVRAGDQVRPRRLPRLLHGGAAVGARHRPAEGPGGLGARLPAERPRAAGRASSGSSPIRRRRCAKIAESKGEAFYRGELAEAMDSHARATGGALRRNDLAEHKADWVDPIGLTYRGTTLHEIPPSGQGIAACMALGILENFDVAGHDRDGPEVAHLQDRGDEARLRRHLALRRRSALHGGDAGADARQALPQEPRQADRPEEGARISARACPKDGGTIYLGTADESGMMVSLIQSNYTGFGSGIVVPGTGIALQNRASGLRARPRAMPTRSARRSGRSTPSSPPSSPRTASRSRPSA